MDQDHTLITSSHGEMGIQEPWGRTLLGSQMQWGTYKQGRQPHGQFDFDFFKHSACLNEDEMNSTTTAWLRDISFWNADHQSWECQITSCRYWLLIIRTIESIMIRMHCWTEIVMCINYLQISGGPRRVQWSFTPSASKSSPPLCSSSPGRSFTCRKRRCRRGWAFLVVGHGCGSGWSWYQESWYLLWIQRMKRIVPLQYSDSSGIRVRGIVIAEDWECNESSMVFSTCLTWLNEGDGQSWIVKLSKRQR